MKTLEVGMPFVHRGLEYTVSYIGEGQIAIRRPDTETKGSSGHAKGVSGNLADVVWSDVMGRHHFRGLAGPRSDGAHGFRSYDLPEGVAEKVSAADIARLVVSKEG